MRKIKKTSTILKPIGVVVSFCHVDISMVVSSFAGIPPVSSKPTIASPLGEYLLI